MELNRHEILQSWPSLSQPLIDSQAKWPMGTMLRLGESSGRPDQEKLNNNFRKNSMQMGFETMELGEFGRSQGIIQANQRGRIDWDQIEIRRRNLLNKFTFSGEIAPSPSGDKKAIMTNENENKGNKGVTPEEKKKEKNERKQEAVENTVETGRLDRIGILTYEENQKETEEKIKEEQKMEGVALELEDGREEEEGGKTAQKREEALEQILKENEMSLSRAFYLQNLPPNQLHLGAGKMCNRKPHKAEESFLGKSQGPQSLFNLSEDSEETSNRLKMNSPGGSDSEWNESPSLSKPNLRQKSTGRTHGKYSFDNEMIEELPMLKKRDSSRIPNILSVYLEENVLKDILKLEDFFILKFNEGLSDPMSLNTSKFPFLLLLAHPNLKGISQRSQTSCFLGLCGSPILQRNPFE